MTGRGLEIFDKTGKKIMDSTTEVTFVLGTKVTDSTEGTIVDPRLLLGRPFVYWPEARSAILIFGAGARSSVVGDTISWSVATAYIGIRFIYGIKM